MHARKSRKQWSKIITAFESSGQTHEAFCARHKLIVGTFRTWLYRLRAAAPAEIALLPVEVTTPPVAPEPATIVIDVAGIEIRIPIGADLQYVAGLVAELRARC